MSNPYEWNLSELYSGPNDPKIETDLQEAEGLVSTFAQKWKDRTDYLEQADVLREALDELVALDRNVGSGARPSYFLSLSRVIDQNNSELKGATTVVDDRTSKLQNQLTFFWLNIGRISPEMQKVMLNAPELESYKVYLKRRFEAAAHDLSVDATNALNLITPQAIGAWETMVDELLSEASADIFTGEKTEKVAFNGLPSLLTSSDPRVIEEAGSAMTRIMREVAPIAEREINAIITTRLRLNQLRGYDRSDAHRFQNDDLDATIAESMLKSVEDSFDLSHRFYDLKARLLGTETFEYHERGQKYGSMPDGYTFEQATDMLRTALSKLHPDFAVELDKALQSGHIDAFPREGKSGGAACWHDLIEHPVYMYLNFVGMLDNIQTYAHEFGHYLNNLHMQAAGLCDALTYGSPTPLAEVTSIFFEKYILDEVLEHADEETRLAILVSTLDGEAAKIFRQSAAMRFEQELYAKIGVDGYLSHQQIGEIFQKHMGSYLGPRVSMENGADLWWVYWGHFRNEFYNYGYTFAQLVAKVLQTRLADDSKYIEEVRRLLSTGMSQTTPDLLSSMGIDVSNESVWHAGLDQFAVTLNETEELAFKLGKL